ncbi:MAG: peptidoglycan-associated lipoprotein Pal [Desulfobulbaceae bacterium]|nr:MAG: peptidoglycan-associated lipoprotein Pal [Desulfobulbaceae bacterium]
MLRRIQALLPALLIISLVMFSGCAKKPVDGADQQQGEGMGKEEPLVTKPTDMSNAPTIDGMMPVFFDFDSSDIRSDMVSKMEVNSDFLKANPNLAIRVEGRCDPRGTNEYNMALGERRALSAKKYLVNLGVEEARLSTISYGEEKPIKMGDDELTYAQNRRADFVKP